MLITKIIELEGLAGILIFSIVLFGLGVTYQKYYKILEHFRSLSIKDELTGLFNHRYFQETLQQQIDNKQHLSLLLLDLDHFKMYNDTFGHPQGDQLLKEAAEIMLKGSPQNAITCRYGGEEFAIILPGVTSEEALHIAENIRQTVSSRAFYGLEQLPNKRVTISIGISSYPDLASDKENLIRFADEALYKIKHSTRNNVLLYSSLAAKFQESLEQVMKEDSQIEDITPIVLKYLKAKDRSTSEHTVKVMHYAVSLAERLGLSQHDINEVRFGTLFHDIGKLKVPGSILKKEERLTPTEWAIVQQHVIWGEQILSPYKRLERILPMIRNHHERYDGAGYPDGMAGNEIPLFVRILTIADSFDAMTTNRPYQAGKSYQDAVKEIRECAGKQFDPTLVEPFLEFLEEENPIRTRRLSV